MHSFSYSPGAIHTSKRGWKGRMNVVRLTLPRSSGSGRQYTTDAAYMGCYTLFATVKLANRYVSPDFLFMTALFQ